MQYLLTEDEMSALRCKQRDADKMPSLDALTHVVKHIACTMIGSADPGADPHGCIHVADPRGRPWATPYCDGCPVSSICPLPKDWSK